MGVSFGIIRSPRHLNAPAKKVVPPTVTSDRYLVHLALTLLLGAMALQAPEQATDKITALSGVPPKRVVILAFDNIDQAKSRYNSPAQQEINAMDAKAAKHRWYIVDSAM